MRENVDYNNLDRGYGMPRNASEGWGDRFRHRDRFSDQRPVYSDRSDWKNMRAGDVMTTRVVTVYANDLATYAARVMGECDCGAIPVVDSQGRMIGMITDRDIAIRLVGNRMDTRHARVDDCMTDETFACHVDSPLDECMRTMSRHKIRRLPVLDERDRVVGIISQADLAQHASEHLGRGERRAVSDVVCAISEPTDGSYA
ncbi:MAG TPA: CBS domain-containing protein [Pyrinomonadaceae bacterium]|nr:CBS domain-containing protein [Pyrinomonadaceae bacterium]